MSILSYLRPKSALYVVNESTLVSDAEVKKWCKAVQYQIKQAVAPAWGKPAKTVRFLSSGSLMSGTKAPADKAPKNAWVTAVLDDADQAGALGYHSVDDRGRVYGRVFVKTCQDYGVEPSTTFSHELLETWGDPSANQWAWNDEGEGYYTPIELCDAVEGDSYTALGVPVSNFVLPEWFRLKGNNGSWTDFLGTTSGPFELAKGGYMVREHEDGSTDQVFGDEANHEYVAAKSHELGRTNRRRK